MEVITIAEVAVGMILLILVPGILLSLALFPRKKDLDPVERLGVGAVLGLTPQFLLYFGDKNLYLPITEFTSTATVVLVSLVGLAIWLVRVKKIKEKE